MIKNYLTLFAVLLSCTLFAQDVPEVQKSMITKSTASWCTNCGTWGWSLMEGLVEDNDENALVIASHPSGDLQNPTAQALIANFQTFSQPRFILGNVEQGANNSNWSSKQLTIAGAVATNKASSPVVNAGLIVSTTLENELIINTRTTFFQATEGEYNLAAYIIEDDVVNFQQSQGPDAVHKNVLRASASDGAFGELITFGTIDAGSSFTHTFTMALDPEWAVENLEVALVIWKKDSETWEFVNTNETSDFDAPIVSSLNDISAENLTMEIQPTVATGQTSLILDIAKDQQNLDISIVNQLGQVQTSILAGSVSTGKQTIAIGNGLTNGVYFVVARIGNQVSTKRFILQ